MQSIETHVIRTYTAKHSIVGCKCVHSAAVACSGGEILAQVELHTYDSRTDNKLTIEAVRKLEAVQRLDMPRDSSLNEGA